MRFTQTIAFLLGILAYAGKALADIPTPPSPSDPINFFILGGIALVIIGIPLAVMIAVAIIIIWWIKKKHVAK